MTALRFKLTALVLASVIVAMAVGAGASLWIIDQTGRQQIGVACAGMGPITNASLAGALQAEPSRRDVLLARLTESHRRATGADLTVFDSDGRFLAGTPSEHLDEPARSASAPSGPVDGRLIAPLLEPDGTSVGFIAVGVPTASPVFWLSDAWPIYGAAAAILIVMTLGWVTYVARALTHPLRITRDVITAMLHRKAPPRSLRGPFTETFRTDLSRVVGEMGELAASSHFVHNVVQSMVDSLVVVDRDAKIKAINQAAMELLGYEEQDLIGRTASLICIADGRHLTADEIERLLGTGAKNDHEVVFIARDGARIPISLGGSAIKDADGQTTGYVCIGTDIRDRKAAEAEREELHKRIVATSRQAGMAEVATGVLHNVGNVLNSVNVSASLVKEQLQDSKVCKVTQIASLIHERRDSLADYLANDPGGQKLPEYLRQLASHLEEERERVLREVGTLTDHVAHIKDIISVQQVVAKTTGVIEPLDLRELLEDAARMCVASLDKANIRVRREYGEIGVVTADKHKVLQILVNLIHNARDAMGDQGVKRPTLTLRVRQTDEGVEAQVEDNGIGIDPAVLTKIFTHGFTTKPDGHGFGLHSAATAAQELSGSLNAESAGPGHGAVFTLMIPAQQVQKAEAA